MKFLLKGLIGVSIFSLIEAFFYFKTKPRSLDTFFMIWALIAFMFLLYNILNESSEWDNSKFAHRSFPRYMGSTVGHKEAKQRKKGGLFDPLNLLYLFLVLVNAVVCYYTLQK